MKAFPIKQSYSFDDLMLIPKYSEIRSRMDIDLSVNLGKGIKLNFPIFPANMATVTDVEMAKKISSLGGLAILHRFSELPDRIPVYDKFKQCKNSLVGVSVGVQETDKKIVDYSIYAGCNIICIDVANGENVRTIEMTEWIAKNYPEVFLISGNVCSGSGALRLYNAGANAIRCGVGNGSICITRIKSGNGVPQVTALFDVFQASLEYPEDISKRKFKIICDGGLKTAGDLSKALVYSDLCMSGRLFSGCNETPGEIIKERFFDTEINLYRDKLFKKYYGSSMHRLDYVEGVESKVECKGPVENVLNELLMGLRSGMSYQGAKNLEELKEDPQFVQISTAGMNESLPHILHQK